MTIDKERLKDLAEAATGGVWQCEKDVQGRLHVTAGDFLDIAEVGYRSGPNPEADAQFMAAARPEVVLALLAEIERIELVSRLSCNHDGYMAVLAEREQLKAENEALRESANFRAIQSLRGDCEELRKDAERYRWLRSRDLETISQGGVFAGITPQNMVLNEETLDQAVDAAMTKEAQP